MNDDDFFDDLNKSLDDEWQFEEWQKDCKEDSSAPEDAEEDSDDDSEDDTGTEQDFYVKLTTCQKSIPASKPSPTPTNKVNPVTPWIVNFLVPFFFGLCFKSFTAVIVVFVLEALLFVFLWFCSK